MKETPSIGDRVIELVQQHWSEHRTPMLLSTLGNLDGGVISAQVKREYDGLRSFLEQILGERLLVVEHSQQQTIVGVVPRTEDTDKVKDWDPLLEKTRSEHVRPRLNPVLWAAFRKPLAQGKERFVLLDDRGIRFADVASAHPPANGLGVPSERIVGYDATVEKTYEHVREWIESNHLDIDQFRHSASARDSQNLPSNDLLGRLINALDAEDLRKVSIPMDVVAKLRRHPS